MDTEEKRINMINYDCYDSIALPPPVELDLDDMENFAWLLSSYTYGEGEEEEVGTGGKPHGVYRLESHSKRAKSKRRKRRRVYR